MSPAQGAAYDVIVSIVHYNTPSLLRRCLDSLRREGSSLRKKIVVVDNASSPWLKPRPEEDPDVAFVFNDENKGFGTANNQVFEGWDSRAYLVINPDVMVSPNSLSPLFDKLFSRDRLGALGVRLRYPNGGIQSSCRRYPTLSSVLLRGFLPEHRALRFKAMQKYFMRDLSLEEPRPVDWIMGSCLLLKAEAVRDVRGFDEKFFMYYEDIDLCYRLNKAGWTVEFDPRWEWIHDYRRESAQKGRWKLRGIHFYSAMRFLKKHVRDRGLYESL